MKEIAKRVWDEPAVCIGLLTSIALVVLNLLGDDTDTINWIEAAAPLLAALGIRPLVWPDRKVEEVLERMPLTTEPVIAPPLPTTEALPEERPNG